MRLAAAHAAGLFIAALAFAACAGGGSARAGEPQLPPGSKYVALGSSFAAGPGVARAAETPPGRCQRSMENYARQLARRRGLALNDVSCSGARTTHLLGPWDELPPQLDAVDKDTRLVTVTIGGNDLGYIGGLFDASCRQVAIAANDSKTSCPTVPAPTEQAFSDVEARMREIAAQVRRRAPGARLVFVDYLAVLPPQGTCAATPLTPDQADASRAIARRLAEITARAAKSSGADLVTASAQSIGHDACAREPWMNGYPRPGAPVDGLFYHPNLAGMTAVADALDRMLK